MLNMHVYILHNHNLSRPLNLISWQLWETSCKHDTDTSAIKSTQWTSCTNKLQIQETHWFEHMFLDTWSCNSIYILCAAWASLLLALFCSPPTPKGGNQADWQLNVAFCSLIALNFELVSMWCTLWVENSCQMWPGEGCWWGWSETFKLQAIKPTTVNLKGSCRAGQ